MFEKIKNTVQAEIQKDAQELNKALDKVKNGISGAKEEAKEIAERIAKNTAVSPLIPVIPAMLYLLKKEKNKTYTAKEVATKRYMIVQDFYHDIVYPYLNVTAQDTANKKKKIKGVSNFDYNEMLLSDFDETQLDTSGIAQASSAATGTDTTSSATSALGDLFQGAVSGGTKGAGFGAVIGTALAAGGVPPPVSNIAGAGVGAELGAIVGACIQFFKLGLKKVKDALSKTGTKADDISAGLPVGTTDVTGSSAGAFDFKKLLLPLIAVVAIYFFVIKKK